MRRRWWPYWLCARTLASMVASMAWGADELLLVKSCPPALLPGRP
jgi:hypothetical protein